jgi:hypothetical protein
MAYRDQNSRKSKQATEPRFCRLFDEMRTFLRPQAHRNQFLSLKQRRAIHQERFAHLMSLMATA